MFERKKLVTGDWKYVLEYQKKDSPESIKLAMIEADKIFIKTILNKGYKAKTREDKILLAIKEMQNAEKFIKAREKVLSLKSEVGYDMDNIYECEEVINTYRDSIEDLLYGIIDEGRFESAKVKYWRFYYPIYKNRRKIWKCVFWLLFVILLMLFIADTSVGREMFDAFVEKIHLIIRIILVTVLMIFLGFFFITLSIVFIESRFKKRKKDR